MGSVAGGEAVRRRRQFLRHDVQCRARIMIGQRHYAGYLHNLSRGGARLSTVTRIRNAGDVLLRLPDLPPLRCQLRWSDSHNAGVAFEFFLSSAVLADWINSRSARLHGEERAIAELESAG